MARKEMRERGHRKDCERRIQKGDAAAENTAENFRNHQASVAAMASPEQRAQRGMSMAAMTVAGVTVVV